MALHSLGLAELRRKSNGQAGLGLATPAQLADAGIVRETNTAAAAPVVGVERTGIDSPTDLRQRATAPAKPRARTGVPRFETDPIGAISFALREVGAALQGKELPSKQAAEAERKREALELRRFTIGLDAVGAFAKLPAEQRAAAASGFNAKFGEALGIDFNTLNATVDLDTVMPILGGIDPSLLVSFAGDPERLRKVALDPQRRAVLEETSDAKHLGPAMRKVAAAADQLAKRLSIEDSTALATRRFTFQDISQLADPLGLTGPELAALRRNQVTAFPQIGEITGLRFVSGEVLAEEAKPRGGPTLAQRANNAEITAARSRLSELRSELEPGQSLRELIRTHTQKSTDTGRDNPDYDPLLARDLNAAGQRMVGEDPGFGRFWDGLDTPSPQSPQRKPAPPGDAERPGILDRVGDFFFGGDDAPAPARRGTPRGGGRARGRRGAKAIAAMSVTEIDDLINSRGDSLSPADLRAIEARLSELGM